MEDKKLNEVQDFINNYDVNGKSTKDMIHDYQRMLGIIEELLDEGKIDRRTASELKYAANMAHGRHGSTTKEEKTDFAKTLEQGRATDTEFASYVNSMKADVDKELEQGLFEQEVNDGYKEKVEHGDGGRVM